MPLPTDVEELRAEGVGLIAGSITDLAGVTRAKYVPLRRLEAFQRAGMGVSPSWSVFCVDSGIAFTPNIGVDGDLRIRIDPAELRLVDDGIAWAPGDLTDQRGGAAALCTRSLLAGIESAMSAKGLTAMLGVELECTMLSADAGHASADPWSPYGVRTSLDALGVPRRPGRGSRARRPARRADPHRVRPRPARGVPRPDHPRRRCRHRCGGAHRDRPGRRPARLAHLVLPRALRGRGGQRRASAPVPGRRRRAAALRRPGHLRHATGGRVRDRRGAADAARPSRRLRGLGAVVGTAEAGQLGGRGAVLGPGKPGSRSAIRCGHPWHPARRQHRTQADRSQRQPLPRGRVVSRQRPSWHRPEARPARGGAEGPCQGGAPTADAADRPADRDQGS